MAAQGVFTKTAETSEEHRHRFICAACRAPLDSLPLVNKAAVSIPDMEGAACPRCKGWLSRNLMIIVADCDAEACEMRAAITRIEQGHEAEGCEDCYGICARGGCHCAPFHLDGCEPDCVNECVDCDMVLDTPESVALWAARNRQWEAAA